MLSCAYVCAHSQFKKIIFFETKSKDFTSVMVETATCNLLPSFLTVYESDTLVFKVNCPRELNSVSMDNA